MTREDAEMIVYVDYNLEDIVNECKKRHINVAQKGLTVYNRFEMEHALIEAMIKENEDN